MTIAKLMRRPVQILSPDASCVEAASLMRDENIGSIIVAEDGRPLGVVTDRDLVTRVIATGGDPRRTSVRDVMSAEPLFVSGDRGLDQVLSAMRDFGVRRLPIVDENGRLCGLVSADDLLVLIADQLADVVEAIRKSTQPAV
jgi:CBS domain-containing protein